MSYTLTVEPEIMHEAQKCASRKGLTIDTIIGAYLVSFVERETGGERLVRELDDFVDALPKLKGKAYRFRRAGAYEGVLA